MSTAKYGSYVSAENSAGYMTYVRPFIMYTASIDDDYFYVEYKAGLNNEKNANLSLTAGGGPYVTASATDKNPTKVQKEFKITDGGVNNIVYISLHTIKWARGATDKEVTVSVKVTFPSSSYFYNKTSTASVTFTVPAKSSSPSGGTYSITYNANGGYDAPDPQTKSAGQSVTISSVRPYREATSYCTYEFTGWNTSAGGGGVSYAAGSTYSADSDLTLYAQWHATVIPSYDPTPTPTEDYDHPPTYTIDQVIDNNGYSDWLKGFSRIKVVLTNIDWEGDECETNGITVNVTSPSGTAITKSITSQSSSANIVMDANLSETGNYRINVILLSTNGLSTTKEFGSITVVDPTWSVISGLNGFYVQEPIPQEYSRGTSDITIRAYNYNDAEWDKLDGGWSIRILDTPPNQDPKWTVDGITLNKNQVSDALSSSPSYQLKIEFNTYSTTQTEGRRAFFATTKNALFTSGLANNVFVAGCTMTNYNSRAWYSAPNDPLYFPDTNYVEVGANDTAIMGMIKCGEYLAVVKQAKPTDTSIYMLYPTSYDDNTTYAIRQSISGNGSQSRFSFNVLNDEALFLSPEGITAIVLTEDNQHKLQNRSYYINKPLLKENLEDAYSFIYDGMYLLSVPKDDDNGNKVGKIYVLDGNQMTSWETAKTNLQYEAYIWEGVTAWCLMRYNDELWFSDKHNVYRFKTEDNYNKETGENDKYTDDGSPVKASWSTILDNDGATNYYKSLQKRGNVVTLCGDDLTSARVYFQKDENEKILVKDMPTKYTYRQANPTLAEFNAHKEWYFVIEDDEYVKCIGKTYDQDETYFMLEFEIISGYPIDIFTKKKMKKYKRLQISIENDRAESFGVREIVKTYTIGNYSKR